MLASGSGLLLSGSISLSESSVTFRGDLDRARFADGGDSLCLSGDRERIKADLLSKLSTLDAGRVLDGVDKVLVSNDAGTDE